MSEIITEINETNFKDLDIKKIALNKKFGNLVFEDSTPKLEKLKKLFEEFEDLDYKNSLTDNEVANVDSRKKRFLEFLNRIKDFDISTDSANPRQVHDNIENEIKALYDDSFQSLKTSLIYLRQEAALKSKDEEALKEQQKKALQAENAYKKLSEKLQQEINALDARKKEVEDSYGEVASKQLANHFAKQANDYDKSSIIWLTKRDKIFKWIIGIVVFNFLLYIFLFIFGDILGKISVTVSDFFTIPYGAAKILLISFLSINLSFRSKNYNIESNLLAINKHRKNVAQTLEDFLSTNPEKDIRSQMLKQGTEAMFKYESAGFITKKDSPDSGGVYEIINNIFRNSKD